MKTIFLKKMDLKNFKGIKDLSIDFSKVTNIYGDNGVGKTTINDAFNWLLFNKDGSDATKFDIQPLDENNNVKHLLETEIIAVLNINGSDMTFKKILKEKWVKPRGQLESELKGTTTDYYINEVPQKEKDYKSKIDEIIPEQLFKLLTNPLYFASVLDWKERRKIIFDISSEVSQEEVINSSDKLKELHKLLNPNETMEDFQKRISAQISKLKKDKANIPARVDECSRSIRNDIDFSMQESNKKNILEDIKKVEEQILDSSKVGQEVLNKKNQFYDLKSKLRDMEYSLKLKAQEPLSQLQDKLREVERNIYDVQSKANMLSDKLRLREKNVKPLETLIINLRSQWNEENQKVLEINENEFICPTCKRPFEAADVEAKKREMLENFNQGKASRLEEIRSTGKAKSSELEQLKQEIEQLKQEHEVYDSKLSELVLQKAEINKCIADFQPDLDFKDNTEYQELKKQIEALESEINTPAEINNQVQELKHKKSNLEIELEGINNLLSYKEQNKSLEKRKVELIEEEKRISQQIADLEKGQFLTEEFTRLKVNLMESSINSKFKMVKIKLFKNQVNGGLDECCEVMVNGVPFSTNLNNGARINAGLDIINTLSEHYEVQAPIFIDNKESVTKLINVNSQVITLIVNEKDKKLRIESEEV